MKLRPNVAYDVRINSEGVSVWVERATWYGGPPNSDGQIVLWAGSTGTAGIIIDSWDRITAAFESSIRAT